MARSSAAQDAHVLVVEDDPVLRQMVVFLLRDEGYVVIEVSDGSSALEVLQRSPQPLVVVLDCWSPGKDGAEVLHALGGGAPMLQQHAFLLVGGAPLLQRHAFLLVGATVHPDPALEALEHHPELRVADLPKPFNLADLLRMVATFAAALRRADA